MKSSFRVYAAVACSMTLWASAFVAIRMGLESYSPGSLALLRFVVASLCTGLMLKLNSQASMQKLPWPVKIKLMLIGVLGISIYHTALNLGEVTVSAGIASFVVGLMPVLTIILSIIFLKEKPGVYTWPGVALSMVGLLVIMVSESESLALSSGVLFILISALAGSIQTVTQKPYVHDFNPITVSAWVIWGGTLVLFVFSPTLWSELKTASSTATWAGIYLGIFPAAFAYISWGYVLKAMPASKATLFFYTLPIFSTLMGYGLLNEQPSASSLMGGALALLGAMLASKKKKLKHIEAPEVEPTKA